jgi:hypothetical protein
MTPLNGAVDNNHHSDGAIQGGVGSRQWRGEDVSCMKNAVGLWLPLICC